MSPTFSCFSSNPPIHTPPISQVIGILIRYETDPGVQRWGLAALGTVCAADERLAQRAVDAGAAKSVIWALGADVLSQERSKKPKNPSTFFGKQQMGHGVVPKMKRPKNFHLLKGLSLSFYGGHSQAFPLELVEKPGGMTRKDSPIIS